MTVNPGWGGQTFIASSLDKIAPTARRCWADDVELEVDGGHRRRHRRCRAPTRARRSSSPEAPCSGRADPAQAYREIAAAAGCS